MTTVDIRIPISPTPHFFRHIELFNYSLRRLGGPYRDMFITVIAGGDLTAQEVVDANPWAADFNIRWFKTPDELLTEYSYLATCGYRAYPETITDVVCFMDADTVLFRDFDVLLESFPRSQPAFAGHMAHFPPAPPAAEDAVPELPAPATKEFWPWLFQRFGIRWPTNVYDYSIGDPAKFVQSPLYCNDGFVMMSEALIDVFRAETFRVFDELTGVVEPYFRGQVGHTLMSYGADATMISLPATFNTANDEMHLRRQLIDADEIRILHYLREVGFTRKEFLMDGLPEFLDSHFENAGTARLQALVQDLAAGSSR